MVKEAYPNPLEHFPEKHALVKTGVDAGFPSENATTKDEVERFPIQSNWKALYCGPIGNAAQARRHIPTALTQGVSG
jgi:hypothetical protein